MERSPAGLCQLIAALVAENRIRQIGGMALRTDKLSGSFFSRMAAAGTKFRPWHQVFAATATLLVENLLMPAKGTKTGIGRNPVVTILAHDLAHPTLAGRCR